MKCYSDLADALFLRPPESGSRWWMTLDDRYSADQRCVGELYELPIGRWPDAVEVGFTVVRVDRLRHAVLLEAP